VGYQDETWWSRLAQPNLRTWQPQGQALRLVAKTIPESDSTPKALACYGVWVPELGQMWLRCVADRPLSALTVAYLGWCAEQAAARGRTRLVLIWDNAGWHTSRLVQRWIGEHNRQVLRSGAGARIVPCRLPSRSPWLNPIEAKWAYGKRQVAEPSRVLAIEELEERVYGVYGCPPLPRLDDSQCVS
jgi:DDE superfamily endonuclease